MITDADTKKLLKAFSKVFPTKIDLKALEARQDKKFVTKGDLQKALKDQTGDIVDAVGEYIADTIVPMFEQRDKKIARIEKKLNLPPLAD